MGTNLKESPLARGLVRHKRVLGVAVLVGFLVFLIFYIAINPSVIRDAFSIGWLNFALLFALYLSVLATHFGILQATIRSCEKSLPLREGFLLTVYSTVANFFGPLQSGPGVRAVYLKSRIALRWRDFARATIFYYLAFGAINAALIFSTTAPWLSGLGVAAAAVLTVALRRRLLPGSPAPIIAIAGITLLQVLLMAAIYFVEINAVSSESYSAPQAVVFAATANLSLFVSVTPGAIGIREAFLYFSESLHDVPVETIIAAGLVDRAFYVIFLGLLFAFSSIFNLKGAFAKRAG